MNIRATSQPLVAQPKWIGGSASECMIDGETAGRQRLRWSVAFCIMGSRMTVPSCDLVLASETTKFADRAVRWGSAHHEYPTHFWERGIKKAKEYL